MQVVSNAVRQLQHCVTERAALDCVELYQLESRNNATGGLCRTASKRLAAELGYQRKAETSLQDENCFKIFIVSGKLNSYISVYKIHFRQNFNIDIGASDL